MAIDASIYNNLGAGVTPLMNPLDIQARKIAIRNALAAGQMQDLQLQQQRQSMTDEHALRAAVRDAYGNAPTQATAPALPGTVNDQTGVFGQPLPSAPPMPASAPAAAAAAAPPVAVPPAPPIPTMAYLVGRDVPPAQASALIQQFQKVDETNATIQQTRANALKLQKEANDLVAQQASDMANSLVRTAVPGQPINPDLLNWNLQHFASLGPQEAAQAQQVRDHLATLAPADQITFLKTLAGTPKTSEANSRADDAQTAADRLATEKPKMIADGALAQLTAAGKAPIQPVEQARLNQEAQNIAERARHAHVEENNAALNRESVQLTPQALDQIATMFATTGQLPNLGMGAAVAKTRSSIINRAAELFPNVALASNAAAYQANKHSLNTVTGTLDTLSAFENAGLKNLKMFTDAAAKIPDTGVPWLNTPVRMLDEKLVGSANMSVVNAAREIGLREIARVTNDPKLSGVLSDSARHEVQGFSPANATLPQILAVAKTLQQDMANVHQSLQEQKEAISNRIGTDPNAKPASSAPAYKVGDSVMYNGAPHKVTAVKPDGKLVLAN
jgi:hypothetical protein